MFLPLAMRAQICVMVDALRSMLLPIAKGEHADPDAARAGLDDLQRLENVLCLSAVRVVTTPRRYHRADHNTPRDARGTRRRRQTAPAPRRSRWRARRDAQRQAALAQLAGGERMVFEVLLAAEEPLTAQLLLARTPLACDALDRVLHRLRRKQLIVRWVLTHGVGYTVPNNIR